MNHVKAIAFGLLLAGQLTYSNSAFSATGTVILRDKDNAICSFPLPGPGESKTYSFVNPPRPCEGWDDRARSIQLAEIPSATTIFVGDTGDCQKYSKNNWLILKTIKKLTSTSIQEIEYLTAYQKGQIIEPGLQMVDLQSTGEFRDDVSCIKITTSAAPPSP